MDDQFDNDLKNRIKEVFENFDDPSAGEGWLQLRKKYPEEADRRPVAWIWWGAAAAILLIFLGIGIWIKNEPVKPENFTHKAVKHGQSASPEIAKARQDTAEYTKSVSGQNSTKAAINNIAAANPNSSATSTAAKKSAQPNVVPVLSSNNAVVKNTLAVKKTVDSIKTGVTKAPALQLAVQQNTVIVQQNAVTDAQNAINSNPVAVTPLQPKKSITSMFTEDHVVSRQKSIEKSKNYSKKVLFGVYATTYFNYARGSNNQVNGGVGITSDIAISKHLKFVTGIAIAQNTLNYSGSGNSNLITGSALPSSVSNYYYASSGAAPGANVPKIASFSDISAPTFKNYNASLVGLDIPLNLKYEFNPQKNSLYISAGVSSGTFVNETYTYQYNTPSFFSASIQKTQDQTTNKSFNGFYFAKTLNLALGLGHAFGRNRVIIEPFLKYPLEGLGSQQIRFGAGGVNLKFNFESLHK